MDKKMGSNLEKLTSAVAKSSAGLSFFPYCTIILHQPELPAKLKREIENKSTGYENANCNM